MTNMIETPLKSFPLNQGQLGQTVCLADGTKWRCYLIDAGDATLNTTGGQVFSHLDGDGYEATIDESAGNDRPAGVSAVGAKLVDAEHAWLQVYGEHTAVAKAAGVDSWADGDIAIMHATSDGVANKASADPAAVADLARKIGRAIGASDDPNDTVPLFLDIDN